MQTASAWDSLGGQNYRLEFNMLFRGWQNYLAVGVSANPHGGIGYLEFRNLFSNYFGYERERRAALGTLWENELGRDLDTWNHDSNTWNFGDQPYAKAGGPKRDRYMTVDYMDLHILQPECGIGVHRHRDNQEVFPHAARQGNDDRRRLVSVPKPRALLRGAHDAFLET